MGQPTTFVYIDGLNLYYGALKRTRYRWLDLRALCQKYLPHHNIGRIKYFTARISGRPGDPDAPNRQNLYLRALATLPEVDVIFGSFQVKPVRMALANPGPSDPKTVEVMRTDEKGSDVNLATHMLVDCFEGRFQVAVVVSNDSDLLLPIQTVRSRGCLVGLLNPQHRPSRVLVLEVTFVKNVRGGPLGACQFPEELRDDHGTFRKPPSW